MNRNKKVLAFLRMFVLILSGIITGVLFVCSIVLTTYLNLDTHEQQMVIYSGKPVLTLLGCALFGLVAFLLVRLTEHFSDKKRKFCVILFCVFSFTISFLWIVISKALPTSDSLSVYELAVEFSRGNYAAIVPKGSYLACYPHQFGLIGFYQLVFEIIPLHDFRVLQCLNVPLITLFILSSYQITRLLCSDKRAASLSLILISSCVSLFMYSTNVYGDIPAVAFISFGVWMLLWYFRTSKKIPLLLSVLALLLSVLVRENSLIFAVAYMISLACFYYHKNRYLAIVLPLIIMILCLTVSPGIKKMYESIANSTVGAGIPSTAHIAMGLQEGPIAPGWYNGYNFNTFIENDYDSALTDSMSKESIKASFQEFGDNPAYAVSFFGQKVITQWTEPTYHCLLASNTPYGKIPTFIENFFSGTEELVFVFLCNISQSVLYLGAAAFILLILFDQNKKPANSKACDSTTEQLESTKATQTDFSVEHLIGLIALIGGMLFHIIWEGKARYVMPYCFFLIPYSAIGLTMIGHKSKIYYRYIFCRTRNTT